MPPAGVSSRGRRRCAVPTARSNPSLLTRPSQEVDSKEAFGVVLSLAWSWQGDGYVLVSGSTWSPAVRLWSWDATRLRLNDSGILGIQADAVSSVAWKHNGSMLAAGDVSGKIHVLKWQEVTNLNEFKHHQQHSHTGKINSLTFSPSPITLSDSSSPKRAQHIIASAGDDHSIFLWDEETTNLGKLVGHEGEVQSVDFVYPPQTCLARLGRAQGHTSAR